MFDCGMHMGFKDDRRFPDFSYITGKKCDYWEQKEKDPNYIPNSLDHCIDAVIITHFHLDHCGALPYMTEMVGYNGPIYMTHPTKAIAPLNLEDFRKVAVERQGEKGFFTSDMLKNCLKKITAVNLHETIQIGSTAEFTLKCYYAGHVLGAGMFLVKNSGASVFYTGDYNMTADRHLGAAKVDICRPTLLITESTYATTIRDSKRCRERDFLKKVFQTVEKGGKVLIPVFALGRAQELCILLEQFWERMNLKHGIYFSMGLSEKATNFYKLYLTWTNERIKKTFVQRNAFDFKHIQPFDRSMADDNRPMVVLATPGMLHAGLSLELFKKWCSDGKNTIIMPGYCVAGTIGHKVLNGLREIELKNGIKAEIKMAVEYMSFSAHADAKGILQLIRTAQPENVMLVHGENSKMNFLADEVTKELGLKCYKPANGETVTISAGLTSNVDCRMDLIRNLERTYGPMALTPSEGENITYRRRIVDESTDKLSRNNHEKERILNLALVIANNNEMCIMSDQQAFQEFKVASHIVQLDHTIYNMTTHMFNIGIIQAIELTFERQGIVDAVTLLSNIKDQLTKKLRFITIFQSFNVEISFEMNKMKFMWLYGDDDFADDFLFSYEQVEQESFNEMRRRMNLK